MYWTAPEQGSGCIQLKAMVVERNDYWFMDDGGIITNDDNGGQRIIIILFSVDLLNL